MNFRACFGVLVMLLSGHALGADGGIDASAVAKQWRSGDHALVCQIHGAVELRDRCIQMVNTMAKGYRENSRAMKAREEARWGSQGYAYLAGCDKFVGVALEQCDIRESLLVSARDRDLDVARRATLLLQLIRGQH